MPELVPEDRPSASIVAWLRRGFQEELTRSDRDLLARYLVLRALERLVDEGPPPSVPRSRRGRRRTVRQTADRV